MRPLPASFYDRPVLDVARDLMGCRVVASAPDGEVTLRLTEVEAYAGTDDPGSHAFRGPTPRTEVMFGPPGHLYVYFSYGMHWCMNLVCGPAGMASAVLLRAGEVTGGLPVAQRRRPGVRERDLARGPARLTKTLGIDGGWHGDAVTEDAGRLRVLPGNELKEDAPPGAASATSISAGPRVGVSGAGGVAPWRFWLDGEPTVSPYRAAQPRRRRVPDSPP